MGADTFSSSVLQCSAAFFMALGPGTVGSFYTAMSGYYIDKFQDRTFFIAMMLCYCAPQPVVALLQQSFDSFFDEKFSTRVTYAFRVIAMQLTLAAIVSFWMYGPETRTGILVIGCLLGFTSGAVMSSSLQMVASMTPSYIVVARLGLHGGGLVPIFVFLWIGFESTASRSDFQLVLSSAVVLCVLSACILGYLHITTELFSEAYKRLAYDLRAEPSETDPLGEDGFERQVTATQPLRSPSEATVGDVSWIKYWQASLGLLSGIGFYLASLVGFFGDSSTAQNLSLLRLCMDLLGRVASLPVPCMQLFKEGPWHKVMTTCLLLFLGLSGVCCAKLFGLKVSQMLFMSAWCGAFAVVTFTSSLVDVTSGSYTEVRNRKALARTNQMIYVTCVLTGLLVAQLTGMFLQHRSPISTPPASTELLSHSWAFF